MSLIFLFLIAVVLLFGFVVFIGAPFLPTRQPQIEAALDLLNLKKGQTLLELGCGDGRVLKLAAKKGIYGVGYEINPVLWLIAQLNTWRYRGMVNVVCSNYWVAKWPKANGIYVFLGEKHMSKLHKKIIHYRHRPLTVVSYAFQIKEIKSSSKRKGMYLYLYH